MFMTSKRGASSVADKYSPFARYYHCLLYKCPAKTSEFLTLAGFLRYLSHIIQL